MKRLETIGASDLLFFDNDYVNAIYLHMPSLYQHDWDNFDIKEFKNPWKAFMSFMSNKAEFALKKRALVESLKDMEKEKPSKSSKVFGSLAVVTKNDEQDKKYQEMKDKCGPCKLCHNHHTFHCKKTNSDKPSDRFIQCKLFNNMTSKQRAQVFERNSACSRCQAGVTRGQVAELQCSSASR